MWDSSEPQMRQRGAGVGKFRFATAATILPVPEMRVQVPWHYTCIDVLYHLAMVSLPYTGFPKSTFLSLSSNVNCNILYSALSGDVADKPTLIRCL